MSDLNLINNAPKQLLLLVDGVPSPNGGGSNQTLANLFSGYKDKLIYLEATDETQEGVDNRMSLDIISFPVSKWKTQNNRLGKFTNNWIVRRQLTFLAGIPLNKLHLPDATECVVFLSTTVPRKLLMAYRLLMAGYRVVPYFMDDWLYNNSLRWKGGNIQQVAKDILEAAPCWLMISRQLEKTLRERYRLEKKPCLIVHNPAPAPLLFPQRGEVGVNSSKLTVDNTATVVHSPSTVVPDKSITNSQPSPLGGVGGGRLIIYAGSIWPMHADALIATAKAVHKMQDAALAPQKARMQGCKLIVYTGDAHWKKYQSQLEGPGVSYGGWKPYNEIHKALQDAWLLLCTASFEEQYKAFSDSSVQTKLTDYMAVGKPVLFVGPADAASGIFVEELEIGFTIETNRPTDIAARLEAISRMPVAWERKATTGRKLAGTRFSKVVVQEKLYNFLKKHNTINLSVS